MKKIIFLLPLLLLAMPTFASGTKEDPEILYKYHIGADLQFRLAKGLKLNVEPELRYKDGYDKFMLSTGVSYKLFDGLYLGATYRLEADREESDSQTFSNFYGYGSTEYDTDYYHRYAFDVTYKDKFGRFTPSLRVRYNNFADDQIDDKEYMRYRGKVEYNIRKCKLTPFASLEAFQALDQNNLYKMRYAVGFDLKSSDDGAWSFSYKLDYFNLEYKNANIFTVGYKYKF